MVTVCPKTLMSANICAFRDIMCGKLFCFQGNANPNYGRLVQFSNCKASFYSDRDNDFGQVDTGTKCDDEKVTIEKSQMATLWQRCMKKIPCQRQMQS